MLELIDAAFSTAAEETSAMVDHARAAGCGTVALCGRSLGGIRAFLAATAVPVDRLALLVTGGNFPVLLETTSNTGLRSPESRDLLAKGMLRRALSYDPVRHAASLPPMPVFLAAAARDHVVPIACGHALRDALAGRKDFSYREYPDDGHALTDRMIEDAVEWLQT